MFQENPPDSDSPKSGPNLLHVLILYFSICSMGKVKTHCAALDVLWREAGRIFPSMHVWPATLWLFLGWYFLLIWGIRAAAAGAVGTVWRATVVLCRRVLLLLYRSTLEGWLVSITWMPKSMQIIWCDIEKEISKGLRGEVFLPMSLAQCIACLLESWGHILINTVPISAAHCQEHSLMSWEKELLNLPGLWA